MDMAQETSQGRPAVWVVSEEVDYTMVSHRVNHGGTGGDMLTSNVGELGQQAVKGRHVELLALSFLLTCWWCHIETFGPVAILEW